MPRNQMKPVSIVVQQDLTSLSKGQKAFNKLIQQIEKKRTHLAAWEATAPRYQKQYTEELLPLFGRSEELQIMVIKALDLAIEQKGLTKSERRNIAGLIAEMAGALLAERDDLELKTIFNRYSDIDYDEMEAVSREEVKFMLEGMLDMELGGDLDLTSPEDILKHIQTEMQSRQAQQEAAQEQRAKRKKSAKQLAKEEQQQVEEQQVSLSIREVYRRLI